MSGGGEYDMPFVQKLGMVMSNLDSMRAGRGPVYNQMEMMKYASEMKKEKIATAARTKKNEFGRRFAEKAGQLDQYEADPDGYTDAVIGATREEQTAVAKSAREEKLADEKAAKLQAKIDKAMEDGVLSPQEAMSIDSDKGLAAVIDQQKTIAAQKIKDEETRRLNEAMFGPGGGQPAPVPPTIEAQPPVPQDPMAAQMQEQQQMRSPQVPETQASVPQPQVPDIRSSLGLPPAPYVTDAELERLKAVYAINPEAGQRFADDLMKSAQFRMEQAKHGETVRQYEAGELDEDAKVVLDARLLAEQRALDAKLLKDKTVVETGIRREPKLEQGTEWIDPTDPSKGAQLIKGGVAEAAQKAADAEVAAAQKIADEKAFSKQVTFLNMNDAITNAISRIDASEKGETLPVAGAGGLLSYVPMTAAKSLFNDLQIIRSNLGFSKLQQMREESPTGAALGPVSDFENRLLQSTEQSLDQTEDPAALRERLASLKIRLLDFNTVSSKDPTKSKIQYNSEQLLSDPSPENIAAFDERYGAGAAALLTQGVK